jgi:pteridine reductase
MSLTGKTILITGAARRIGRQMALACAVAGADIVLHYSSSAEAAETARQEILALGRQAHLLPADLGDPLQAAGLVDRAWQLAPLDALINNAAIFEPLGWQDTSLEDWQRHLQVNLTAPFQLSQAFARRIAPGAAAGIVNILDWRALRPGADHLPYTISKAALAALTRSLAVAFAPRLRVNAVALGAILPPSDGSSVSNLLESIPAHRWARLEEVTQAVLFLIDGPEYITGEIIHVDGGRHLI